MESGEGRQVSPAKRVLLDPSEYRVIHDSSDSDEQCMECQLEKAFEDGVALVVVEPQGLGENSIKWIKFGNFLHKSAVLSAVGALVLFPSYFISKKASFFTFPLGVFSVGCASMYGLSWQFDPCCKYQVDYKGRELTKIPSREIHTASPVVLVKRNDKYRKIVHNTLAVVVTGCLSWVAYKHFTQA